MLIGELSRLTGTSPRSLRYYEAQGLLEAVRGPNGYRTYTEDALLTVRQIRALLDAGLTTEVIRSVLPCVRGEEPEVDLCVDLQEVLGRELAATEARMDDLRRHRDALARYLGHT